MSCSSPINKTSAQAFSFVRPGPSQTLPLSVNLQTKETAEDLVFARPIKLTRVQVEDSTRMTSTTVANSVKDTEEIKRTDAQSSKASIETSPARPSKPKAITITPDKRDSKAVNRPKRTQPQSAHPMAQSEEPKSLSSLVEKSEGIRSPSSQLLSSTEYRPYTLKDYRAIKTNKYLELGGLGASVIGTEEWERKKELSERRKHYARQVLQANANRIALTLSRPLPGFTDPPASDNRSRALEFAKRVKPPLARQHSSEREDAEEYLPSHLKDYVQEMKARLMS